MEFVTIKNCKLYHKRHDDEAMSYDSLDVNVGNICSLYRAINNGRVKETELHMANGSVIWFRGSLMKNTFDIDEYGEIKICKHHESWSVKQPYE